jgi:hypothetical protein
LGPFKAPAIVAIRDKHKVALLDKELFDLDFLHDGVFYTDARLVATECLDNGHEFDFGKRWSKLPAGRQFLHRSGTLFVRILTDLNGLALVVTLGNYLYMNMSKDPKLKVVAQAVFQQFSERIDALVSSDDNKVTTEESPALSPPSSMESPSIAESKSFSGSSLTGRSEHVASTFSHAP